MRGKETSERERREKIQVRERKETQESEKRQVREKREKRDTSERERLIWQCLGKHMRCWEFNLGQPHNLTCCPLLYVYV